MRAVFTLVIALFLAGCNTTLQITRPDPTTGLYATGTVLKPSDVVVEEQFDPVYKRMLYVKIESKNQDKRFSDFFTSAFKEMNVFDKVLTKDDLESFIIEKSLGNKIPGVSDLVSLNNLSKEIGPFLIVEPDASYLGGYKFEATLKAVDASTGKTVLLLDAKALNMSGLDDPLLHPLINGFINWAHNKPVVSPRHTESRSALQEAPLNDTAKNPD